MNNTTFLVRRDNLSECRFDEGGAPPDLESGDVLLKVDKFAFTANNITYAETGYQLGYWKFFAAPEGWGVVPVWGFADVVASRYDLIAPGERLYGYLPMASHMVLRPDRIRDGNLMDATPHRQELPAAYNHYLRVGHRDYDPGHEDLQALLRPLFVTSFLIEDFLADNGFFGADTVLIASASSKTAMALAHLLHAKHRGRVRVIGLTSASNAAFVNGLGCYDQTIPYEAVATLPQRPTVLVDMAGSGAVRRAVHTHLGDNLTYSCAVGLSHRDMTPGGKDLPGVRPKFFFAPDRMKKRNEDWGRGGIDARVAEAWSGFVPKARDWLVVSHGRGKDAVEAVYRQTLDGKVAPDQAHMLSL